MGKAVKPKPLLALRLKRLTPTPIKKFAEKLGIEAARYYAYLAGERPPDATLAVIARHLNVSLDDLLAAEDVVLRPTAVPIVGRSTGGNLAKESTPEGAPRTIRLDLGDLLVTITVERKA